MTIFIHKGWVTGRFVCIIIRFCLHSSTDKFNTFFVQNLLCFQKLANCFLFNRQFQWTYYNPLFSLFRILFLIMSAVGLTYKILDLEAKISARATWSPESSVDHRLVDLHIQGQTIHWGCPKYILAECTIVWACYPAMYLFTISRPKQNSIKKQWFWQEKMCTKVNLLVLEEHLRSNCIDWVN